MLKRFMFLSIGILCLMLSMVLGIHIGGQRAVAQGTTVKASSVHSGSFILQDESGKKKSSWFVGEDGSGVLQFYDADGDVVMQLTSNSMWVSDDEGDSAWITGQGMALGSASSEAYNAYYLQEGLGFHDGNGVERGKFVMRSQGTPLLTLSDANGTTLVRLPE